MAKKQNVEQTKDTNKINEGQMLPNQSKDAQALIEATLEGSICNTRELLFSASEGHSQVLQLFDQMIDIWLDHFVKPGEQQEILRLLLAIEFAADAHQDQIRKNEARTPYIHHPLTVCRNVWREGGIKNTDVLIAALLHDTLEDNKKITSKDICESFGEHVSKMVEELTNDTKLSSTDNKQRQIDKAPSMSIEAKTIKLADRLSNIRDLISTPPVDWDRSKLDEYFEWGHKLLAALRGSCIGLEMALETVLKEGLPSDDLI
jgi:guanosine-3',5'-bis(diphosphate) 3'-pyrophosphohydrolase